MKYVDICIALYDYEAQNDEEISFSVGSILYILQNNDRDWFKAQLKLNSEQDGPIGLVPSNYIEKAKSIGSVKALYDYQARSKEEISFKENDTLILYEKDDPDWYIVEASKGDIGLAPSNYVELLPGEIVATTTASSTTTTAIAAEAPTSQQKQAIAIYSFTPEGKEETFLQENEKVLVIEDNNTDWWTIQHNDGTSGIVPASYLQLQDGIQEEEEAKKRRAQEEEEAKKRREQEEQRKKELEEFHRMKELEEKEKERQAEAERRRKLQENAKKQQQQLAPPVASSPQLGSPRRSQIPAPPPPNQSHNSLQSSDDPNKPNLTRVRTWTDNTGAFKVEAEFLACNNGKIRLHKVNGVKIDVPVGKMCAEDLRYVELETGLKLLEDKNDNVPLARLQKGRFNWLDYFKRMNVSQKASVEYAGTFEANQLTEADIDKLTYRQMKMLGMSEKHIHRFQRYIETHRAEPPSDDESVPKPKLKVKKSVTFGGVSYIDDIPYEDDDQVNWQIEQDEKFARQLQDQEHHHVGLHRRGTGRPTPSHSAPQNVNFSVLTPQQHQPPPTLQNAPPIQPSIQAPIQAPLQPITASTTTIAAATAPTAVVNTAAIMNNQPKTGFEDDAWAPRAASSPSGNNTRSVANNAPPPPARQRPTPQVSQQSMVDPELLAKWGGSPALATANNRPVPAVPGNNNFVPLQQQNTSVSYTSTQQQTSANTFTPLQQQNSFTGLQQSNHFLQHQNTFPGALQPNNNNQTSLRYQQHSPMMNNNTATFQPSPLMQGTNNTLTYQSSPSIQQPQSVPLQSVLPAPLIPQTTSTSSFTPPIHQNSFTQNNMVQPQMTGRNWTTATPDNPFGSMQQNTVTFQQPQNTGFVPLDPNDKYAVFKTVNTSAPSVFNTGH